MKTNQQSRSGFAMMMAIIVVVIIATLLSATLSLTATTSKQTTDVYLRQQAEQLTRSAAEYTLLALSGVDHTSTTNCLNTFYIGYPNDYNNSNNIFNIDVSVHYVGFDCGTKKWITTLSTPETNGTILMDITVKSNPTISSEPIRYTRRTIQKI